VRALTQPHDEHLVTRERANHPHQSLTTQSSSSADPLQGTTFAVVVVLMAVPVAFVLGAMLLYRRRVAV
jgi:hypothetical protein